jgi:hypothetical protein
MLALIDRLAAWVLEYPDRDPRHASGRDLRRPRMKDGVVSYLQAESQR